ncbi:MAG TPA: hypothetical protein ENK18_17965 [Deltaproteobacteria bacterium]|nr:hypothetical protein [Deltaproteobacteria bacterium]
MPTSPVYPTKRLSPSVGEDPPPGPLRRGAGENYSDCNAGSWSRPPPPVGPLGPAGGPARPGLERSRARVPPGWDAPRGGQPSGPTTSCPLLHHRPGAPGHRYSLDPLVGAGLLGADPGAGRGALRDVRRGDHPGL